MLTYHASLPVLWTDPVGRFPDLVRTLDEHPIEGFNLLRGEWLYSRDGPPFDYVPVWVGITTPPATLLLAAFGALALAWRALRRPRDVFRNGPLRFGLLLAALPIATAAAVVILESNVHGDWRHLYFLYAPLLLLAVVGLAAAGGAIPRTMGARGDVRAGGGGRGRDGRLHGPHPSAPERLFQPARGPDDAGAAECLVYHELLEKLRPVHPRGHPSGPPVRRSLLLVWPHAGGPGLSPRG